MENKDLDIMTTEEPELLADPEQDVIERWRKWIKTNYIDKWPNHWKFMNAFHIVQRPMKLGSNVRRIYIYMYHARTYPGSGIELKITEGQQDNIKDYAIPCDRVKVYNTARNGLRMGWYFEWNEKGQLSSYGGNGSQPAGIMTYEWESLDSDSTLFYSSIKPYGYPEFKGNNILPHVAQAIGFAKEVMVAKEVRYESFRVCSKDPQEDHKYYWIYYNYPAFGDSDPAKEVFYSSTYVTRIRDLNQVSYAVSFKGAGNKQWKPYLTTTNKLINLPTSPPPDGKKVYTNNTYVRDSIIEYWAKRGGKFNEDNVVQVPMPKDIPVEDGGGYDCNGDPWPPDGIPPEQVKPGLPTGHKYYIKCIEGTVEMCWTFDGFQKQPNGNWNITAANGRILKYIKDAGCWHFFTSYGAAHQMDYRYRLKDVLTNNKEVYDHLFETGRFSGKIKLNEEEVDISPHYWQKTNHLYFASWTSTPETPKPQEQTWYLALFNYANGTTVKKPGQTTTPIKGHFENGLIYKLTAPWKGPDDWKLEGKYDDYQFTKKFPVYNNFQSNHRVLWNWMNTHGLTAGNHSKFISPCTDPLPDGSLPPGVIGPPRPPKPQGPGEGGDAFGPDKPPLQPSQDPSDIIDINKVTCTREEEYTHLRANEKINGLYYYYLEDALTGANYVNTEIMGTTEAICNVAYAPFLALAASNLCKTKFDMDRYRSNEKGVSDTPWVFRINGDFSGKELSLAKWNLYPSNIKPNTQPGQAWKWEHESRILDFPYRKVAFFSNVFEMYDIIPHLHHEATGGLVAELKAFCPVTAGGNFSVYVNGYKGDNTGFIERQLTSSSMDIPNTSSAYSNYMSTQKAQASVGLQQSALSSMNATVPALAGTMLAAAAIPGVNVAMVGAAAVMGAAGSGGISTLQTMQQNMAYRQDLMTTPKSLKSMGGDVVARLGKTKKATVVACDMQITDTYKDLLARFFHMYGTKQNRVMDINELINSRYYFNYIKTAGCNIISNGIPKRHVAAIKGILDNGATFWHVDRSDSVNVGEYCVYDNVEV